MSFAIDWTLFVILLVFVVLIAWAAYRVGVEEGWRQAGRWADWQEYSDETRIGFLDDRPARRDDDYPEGV